MYKTQKRGIHTYVHTYIHTHAHIHMYTHENIHTYHISMENKKTIQKRITLE